MVKTKGLDPQEFWYRKQGDLVKEINQTGIELEGDLVKNTPVGVSAFLKGGWSFKRATRANPVGIVGQSQGYFLPLELGRKPGKGISKEGQESISLWGQRVLGLEATEADRFAQWLSVKYYREGRPARGFAGLAREGDPARDTDAENLEPIQGGLIKEHLDRLRDRLRVI